MPPSRPSTVAHAILGQLAIRPHSAYELARLGRRFRGIFWTTAESVVYATLADVVAAGHARSTVELHGRRRRTVFRITPAGRRALRRWLAAESAPLAVQHEAMLKVLFGDAGTRADLLRAIGEVRAWAEARLAEGRAMAAAYAAGDGPYPARAHIVSLTWSYQYGQAEQMVAWAAWAQAEVASWPDDGEVTPDLAVFRRALTDTR
jgi:DNA-binding PadR family transcriptional regulator